jgi:hypothetical protein
LQRIFLGALFFKFVRPVFKFALLAHGLSGVL